MRPAAGTPAIRSIAPRRRARASPSSSVAARSPRTGTAPRRGVRRPARSTAQHRHGHRPRRSSRRTRAGTSLGRPAPHRRAPQRLTRQPVTTTDFATQYGPWAVVAGASEGVGSAFALPVAERGVNVVLLARRRQAVLDDVAARSSLGTGVAARALAVDLAEPTAMATIAARPRNLEVGLLMYCAVQMRTTSRSSPNRSTLRSRWCIGTAGARAALPPLRCHGGARSGRHHRVGLGRRVRRRTEHGRLRGHEGLRHGVHRSVLGGTPPTAASTCSASYSARPTHPRCAASVRSAGCPTTPTRRSGRGHGGRSRRRRARAAAAGPELDRRRVPARGVQSPRGDVAQRGRRLHGPGERGHDGRNTDEEAK